MNLTAPPCEPWGLTWTCDSGCLSPEVTGQSVQAATEILWALTGRQFGLCTVTIRPCRRTCNDWTWNLPTGQTYPMPALIGGQWFNLTCGQCGDTCACTELSEVVLPGVVDSITQVKLDGAVLSSSAYRVDNGRLLLRTDGGRWPYCQELNYPDTAPGTWSVTARYGRPVPPMGALAVGELACEITKALNNEECRLPREVTRLHRQGVTINYNDITALMSKGLTGLYLVDQFIQAYNPRRLTSPPKVYNLDKPTTRFTTWTP